MRLAGKFSAQESGFLMNPLTNQQFQVYVGKDLFHHALRIFTLGHLSSKCFYVISLLGLSRSARNTWRRKNWRNTSGPTGAVMLLVLSILRTRAKDGSVTGPSQHIAAIWLPAVPAVPAFSDMSHASEVPGWLQSFRAAARLSQSRMSMSKRRRTSRISISRKSKESRKFSRQSSGQSKESKSLALLSQEQSFIRDARRSDHSAEAKWLKKWLKNACCMGIWLVVGAFGKTCSIQVWDDQRTRRLQNKNMRIIIMMFVVKRAQVFFWHACIPNLDQEKGVFKLSWIPTNTPEAISN